MDTGSAQPDTSKVDTQIAQLVKRLIISTDITQQYVVRHTGIPTATLHRRLMGNTSWSLRELVLISKMFGMPVATLIALAADENEPVAK